MGEVSETGREQADGLQQISQAMEQMDKVTAMTASSAEERSAASAQLSAQSSAMRDVITALSEGVG